jgi:hypothetical protein
MPNLEQSISFVEIPTFGMMHAKKLDPEPPA